MTQRQLREVVPGLRRAAFLYSSVHPAGVIALNRKSLDIAAASMNVELREFVVHEGADLPTAFEAMGKARMDVAVINSEPLLNSQAGAIASLAISKRIPAAGYAIFADAGGLLGHGANRAALSGRSAYFLDRSFKGTKPGDLPIERARIFDLVVNLRTAKALGLKIPQSIALRADRVIE